MRLTEEDVKGLMDQAVAKVREDAICTFGLLRGREIGNEAELIGVRLRQTIEQLALDSVPDDARRS